MDLLAPFKILAVYFQKLFPWAKKVFLSPYFTVIALLLVLGLIVYLVVRIRKRKKDEAGEPVPDVPEEDPPMASNALVSVWKDYIRKIPAEFRRAILLYHPFVVLGDSGSGKSGLIDTYSDWKNQKDQFYPSHTEDQNLQIYQGSKVIIQELSPAVLENTTNEARNALIKLWKPFFKREEITAVVTVRADDLLGADKEGLISQAQIIRGKLNVLSQVMKKPVPVHLAVTFMDRVVGFGQWSRYSNKKGIPTHIPYTPETDLSTLSPEVYETHLTHFLVSEPSGDYLKLLAFFNQQPALYEGIQKFIEVLAKPDPLAASPVVRHIFFTAAREADTTLSNPFRRKEKERKFWQKHPYFRHQVAAAALLILGCFYLGFSHSSKDRYIEDLKEEVADLQQKITISTMKRNYLETLMEKTNAIDRSLLLTFLMDFHPEAKQEIRSEVLDYVRKAVFSAHLDTMRKGGGTYEAVRMMLALIYASHTNQLGDLILENLGHWQDVTGFSEKFMSDYIRMSDTAWSVPVSLRDLAYEKPPSRQRFRELKVFVNSIRDAEVDEYITESQFTTMKQLAADIFEEIRTKPTSGIQDALVPLLNRETVLELHLYEETVDQKNEDRRLAEFLHEFQDLEYEYPDPGSLSLTKFFDNIEAMMAFKDTDRQQFPVTIDGNAYWLDMTKFHRILRQSGIVTFIREYITRFSYPGGLSFFSPDRKYQDLNAALSTENKFFFTTKKIIDGRYTKKTYEEEVKPPLDRFPELLAKLPFSDDEKHRFSSFIYREAEAYGEKYAAEYTDYYSKFSMRADSLGELRFILNQMLLPMSQFQEFMMTLKTNLDLAYGKNDYFRPIMMNLGSMGFMKIIMQNEKDFFPELEKYKAILQMLLSDLETDGSTIPPDPSAETSSLKQILSPAARITLSIFRGDEGSYLKLIEKWSKSMGVPENLGYAFLEPVYQLYRLGMPELQDQIVTVWKNIRTQYLGKDLERFPFNPTASEDADPQNILRLMKADGQFWTQFKMYIAPLCRQVNGQWQPREFEMGSITLPDALYSAANRLNRLSKLLVDENNAPQPLLVDIKADILPRIENRLQFVILTYLQSDTSSVYGFNQRPAWETFKINWWKESQSSIGVEFTQGEKSESKTFRSDTIPNSYWSFYRLLQKADFNAKESAWTWQVDSPENLNWKRAVTFYIKQDPFLVFKENRISQ